MKPILTLAAVVAVMAGAAFGITRFVIKPRFGPAAVAAAAVAAKEKSEKDAEAQHGEMYLVQNILVNPTGTSGTRFLSTTVGLEVKTKEVSEQLRTRDVQVRDVLISILSARTVEQLTDATARDQMRQEIQTRLNTLLGKEELSAVYFVDYVLQ